MNPFTLIADPASAGQLVAFPLDIRLELDDTARFRSGSKWEDVEFPLPFGRTLAPAEVRGGGGGGGGGGGMVSAPRVPSAPPHPCQPSLPA